MTGSGQHPAPQRSGSLDAALAELAPLLRRVAALDTAALMRLRAGDGRLTGYVRLPFGVLAARSVALDEPAARDWTVSVGELLASLDGERAEPPSPRDADWRGALPPSAGWQRVDTVPDEVVRGVVRAGALALKDAAAREGVPGASPRADVADALLDAVVLTAERADGTRASVTLRTVSALTRMGFLPRGSHAAVDVAGRWTRVVGGYGTIHAEAGPGGLGGVRPA